MIQNVGKTFILWLGIILAVSIGAIIWVQNSLLFYPNTSIFHWSPDEEDKSLISFRHTHPTLNNTQPTIQETQPREEEVLDNETTIMIPDDKGGISAFFISKHPNRDFIIYSHGVNGNASDREYVYKMTQEHQLNLVLYDYSGYGKSKGFPTVDRVLKNGLTVMNYVTKKKMIESSRIILWGESMGCAISAYLAKLFPVKGVVLMAGFSSMPHLVSEMQSLGWIRFPLSMITRVTLNSLDTARWISKAKCPVVVMHSKEDDYISFDCGFRNYTVAKEPKLFIQIGGPHIKPEVSFENIEEALQFINSNQSS